MANRETNVADLCAELRIKALLDFAQLVAGERPRLVWKVLQASKTVPEEYDWLHKQHCIHIDTVRQADLGYAASALVPCSRNSPCGPT